MTEKDLFKLIKTSLKTSKKIDLKSASRNIEEWDSLGQLSILTTLDKRFKNKASKLTKLATAETVKDIVSILKKSINKVLLICSDTYTKNIKSINKSCLTIFSDGATATLIKKNNKKSSEYIFYTDGSGADDLKLNFSGNQFQKNKKPELFMDGRKVLSFTLNVVPNIINQTLRKNKITFKNLKYVIFHQASKIVIENLVRKLNIPINKVFINYNKFGNTVSSTIPICLYELMKKNKIKKGDQILICGFGVGLSVGSTIIKI